MKRFLLLLFALFPLLAMAYDFEKDGIYYYITSSTDLTVEVTNKGYSGSYSGDVTIPEAVVYNVFVDVNTEGGSDEPKEENNKIYYTAKDQVFLQNWGDNGDIETVEHTFENGEGCITFSKDVTHIGMGEFSNSRLTSIKLPETVTSIGAYAFMGCYELEKIIIPDGVTEIENEVFFNCYRLAEINLPQKIKAIKNGAFYRCEKLIIDIPDEVEIIGSTAFYGCTSLTSVAIPNSVKEIGSSAFSGCI